MGNDLEKKALEAKRVLELRELQLRSAALSRDAGDINEDELSSYASRYAAAVREWMVVKQVQIYNAPALAETTRGETWVQG